MAHFQVIIMIVMLESDENIYPFGTCYESNFYGQFSELTKIGEYEYTLKCEELNIEGVVDEENIVDGVKFITTEPYGVSKSDEFILYLPGKPASELTEIFMSWTNGKAKNGILESYGLYNVSGGYGFIVWEQGVNVKLKYNCK